MSRASEKERLAEALRRGDYGTFLDAVREANRPPARRAEASEWRHGEKYPPASLGQGAFYSIPPCVECHQSWPCDAEQMRLRAERAEAALWGYMEAINGYVWNEHDLVLLEADAEARRVLDE